MPSFYQFLTDVLILALAVRCRRSHDKTRAPFFVQVSVEVGDPQIVGVADFPILVDGRKAERQSAGFLRGFGFNLINIEGWIRHHVVAAALQIVCVVIEGVCFIAGYDLGV